VPARIVNLLQLPFLNPFLVFAGDFLSGDFLEKAYFDSTHDRMIRGLRTYFESRRADSHAMYYRDALVSSVDNGIPESLAMAEAATLEATQEQHARLTQNDEVKIECLFSGNVSKQEATDFYFKANSLIEKAHPTPEAGTSDTSKNWVPGKEQLENVEFLLLILG
jgi:hypothetical protein